jgi:endonuclease/exonuclease/phosphatase (EEP) superfamily protein YafD
MPQARACVAALDRLALAGEPQLFMGDLNDTNGPILVLQRAGFTDCFAALGRFPRPTIPARPTAVGPDQTIDWLLARGAVSARTAEVVDYWLGDMAPSDHKPVLATYAFSPVSSAGEPEKSD